MYNLNSNLKNSDFSLGMTLHGTPMSHPDTRALVAFLKEELESDDYEKVLAAHAAPKYDEIPVWPY